MNNIYDLLSKDHDKVAKLFEQLQKTTEKSLARREELFKQLKAELDAHSDAEEEIFYTPLEEEDDTHDSTLEAIEEHHLVSHLLEELDSMDKDSDEWMAKLTVLQENVEHHVEEEENELFKKARRVISSTQAEEMGKQFSRQKAQLLKAS